MKAIKAFFNRIYWAIYKLTPKGKRAHTLKQGFEGFREFRKETLDTKLKVVHSAGKLMKQKKILAFHKKESISKPKKSNHQVIETVKHQHQQDLNGHHLSLTKKGTFKRA